MQQRTFNFQPNRQPPQPPQNLPYVRNPYLVGGMGPMAAQVPNKNIPIIWFIVGGATFIILITVIIVLVVKKPSNSSKTSANPADPPSNNVISPENNQETNPQNNQETNPQNQIEEAYLPSSCQNPLAVSLFGGSTQTQPKTFYISASANSSDLNVPENLTPQQACYFDNTCDMFMRTTEGKYKKFTNLGKNILLFCNSGNNPRPHTWNGNLKKQFKDNILVFPDTMIFKCPDSYNHCQFSFPDVSCKYVRIYPLNGANNWGLRWDLWEKGSGNSSNLMTNTEDKRNYSSVKNQETKNKKSTLSSNSGWRPETSNVGQWAGIRFDGTKKINGITIKPRQETTGMGPLSAVLRFPVTYFCLHVSDNGDTWTPIGGGSSDSPVSPIASN